MDEQTLLAHRTLWGEEAEQSSDTELPALCADEQLLYQRLKQHHWGVNVRLEQERISVGLRVGVAPDAPGRMRPDSGLGMDWIQSTRCI